MIHGALTQLITGLVLTLVSFSTADQTKILVKFLRLVIIFALVFANKKKQPLSLSALSWITGLTLANVVVAVFW